MPEESKEENRCGRDTGKAVIRSVSFGSGLVAHITLLLPDIAAPRQSKKHPCFLEAIIAAP